MSSFLFVHRINPFSSPLIDGLRRLTASSCLCVVDASLVCDTAGPLLDKTILFSSCELFCQTFFARLAEKCFVTIWRFGLRFICHHGNQFKNRNLGQQVETESWLHPSFLENLLTTANLFLARCATAHADFHFIVSCAHCRDEHEVRTRGLFANKSLFCWRPSLFV